MSDFNNFWYININFRKSDSQKRRTFPLQFTNASALPGKPRSMKITFSLKCYITAFPDFNQSLRDLLSVIFSRLTNRLQYDSIAINGVQHRAAGNQSSK